MKSFRKIFVVCFIGLLLGMSLLVIPVSADDTLIILHDYAEDVNLELGLADPKIQEILENNIGWPRVTITFDDISIEYIGPGQYDNRFIDQGILLEGISATTMVGGQGDSGPVNGGGMDVTPWGRNSRIRVHLVKPGTTIPTTVKSIGAFTTTPDKNRNFMEFFDECGNSMGKDCPILNSPWPKTTVEFLGATLSSGIAYVELYSNAVPFEVDLLTFGGGGIEVTVDIKPGSYPNSINHKSKGVVPVAVLTIEDFDASSVDPETIKFLDASPVRWTIEDVNNDENKDILFHFKTQELNFDLLEEIEGKYYGTLIGSTYKGDFIKGKDTVKIVP